MDITSLHIESSDMSPDQQVSVKPLQDGRKMASGILSDSDSLSDYIDIAEEFQDSEQVTGSFVRFYTDELHRDFALVDLDDGRKTRVLKRYFTGSVVAARGSSDSHQKKLFRERPAYMLGSDSSAR